MPLRITGVVSLLLLLALVEGDLLLLWFLLPLLLLLPPPPFGIATGDLLLLALLIFGEVVGDRLTTDDGLEPWLL